MSGRQLYEAVLIELNKENAPSIMLEDFNYFCNKAINQYVNKRYNIYDINQQTTDDLRVLKATALLTPRPCISYGGLDEIGRMMGATYEVVLPSDYLHILNCICIYKVNKTFKCYNKGDIWRRAATRLTADAYSQVLDNSWNRPTYRRPYYYIHNLNADVDRLTPPTDNRRPYKQTNNSGQGGNSSSGYNYYIGKTQPTSEADLNRTSLDGNVYIGKEKLPIYVMYPKTETIEFHCEKNGHDETITMLPVTPDIGKYKVFVSEQEVVGNQFGEIYATGSVNSGNGGPSSQGEKGYGGIEIGTDYKLGGYVDNHYLNREISEFGIEQSLGTDGHGNKIYQVKDNGGVPHSMPIMLEDGTYDNTSTVERSAQIRYGNSSTVRMEIRYGADNSVFELSRVYIDYIKAPQHVRLTQEQLDLTEDTSQVLEYPDYVCQEIINELVHIIMENIGDQKLQTHPVVSQSIANPAQQQTEPVAQPQ